jgi:hypothetical protein
MRPMPSRPICRLHLSGALLLASCTGAILGCASAYEPEGQFWPSAGSVSLGVGSTAPADGTSSASAAGATVGSQPDEGSSNPTPPDEGTRSDTRLDDDTLDDIPLDDGTSGVTPAPAEGNAAATSSAAATQGSGGNSAGGGSPTGATDAANSATSGAVSQTCSLSVSVTTTAPGGKYKPRNVGAVWVADASGKFVKSLDVWGNKRLSHVTAWTAATKAAGLSGNKVDAVTSATLSTHRAHNVTWNCRDARDQGLPDGTYRVYFEVTDSNNSGPNHFETFTKGPMATTVQGSATNFNAIVLKFNP